MSEVQQWHLAGDWFDVCKCAIPCPCTFAQAPTYGDCDGILAWHIREGHYGDARLDGLNVVGLGSFEGNIWAGKAKVAMGRDGRSGRRSRLGHGGSWCPGRAWNADVPHVKRAQE